MIMVANFQEDSVAEVHYAAALIAFGSGAVYAWLQAFVSYRLTPMVTTPVASKIRIILALFIDITFIIGIITGIWAKRLYHPTVHDKWLPEDGGWVPHVICVVCEWLTALTLMAFMGSYINEFRKIMATPPTFFLFMETSSDQLDNVEDRIFDQMINEDSRDSENQGSNRNNTPEIKPEIFVS
jgi:heme A synthase